ncbi:hypothetical protein NDU88_004227, partial [Pleurodeles waltl]
MTTKLPQWTNGKSGTEEETRTRVLDCKRKWRPTQTSSVMEKILFSLKENVCCHSRKWKSDAPFDAEPF